MLDIINADVNGCWLNKTIAPIGLIILLYCSHSGSKGMTESHLQAVVPYGKSQQIMSTLWSGMRFIPSKQSSLYMRSSSIIHCRFLSYSLNPQHHSTDGGTDGEAHEMQSYCEA